MEDLYDVYVLAPDRSWATVGDFVEAFLGGMDATADEYEYPQASDEPVFVTDSLNRLVDALVGSPEEPYSLYWRSKGRAQIHSGMMFFTADGGLILGLSVWESDLEDKRDQLKKRYKQVKALTRFESPPPDTVEEFWLALHKDGK